MRNQIEQTEFIKGKFSRYLRSTFDIRDGVSDKEGKSKPVFAVCKKGKNYSAEERAVTL